MKSQRRLDLAMLMLGLVAWAGPGGEAEAASLVINFDNLASMPNAPGLAVPIADQLSNQLLSTDGVLFSSDSSSNFVAVADNSVTGTTSLPNAIGGVNNAGQLSYGTPILISFFLPTNTSVAAATNSVAIFGDTDPLHGTITLNAFDVNGALVGSDTEIDAGGTKLQVTTTNPIIHSISVLEAGASFGNVAFDDLTFTTPLVAVSPSTVPEPNSLMLLGIGAMGVLGYARRRRRGAA